MTDHDKWHWRGEGFRPPWWPEGEPFPPEGRGDWSGMRRRFVRAVAIVLFLVLTLVIGGAVALSLLFTGEHRGRGLAFVLILALFVLVMSFVLGFRMLRRAAGPIGDVMEAADRVATGDYSARVEAGGPGAVRRLARAFNQMTERLGSNEARRRELLSDVAHELRTPLSVIRGNLEGIRDGVYPPDEAHLRRVIDETAVMSRLLDDLQLLSTAEAGALRLHRELTDPATLIEDAVDAFQTQAAEKNLLLEHEVASGIGEINVDPVRIGQVLTNLLSNAVRHTPPGGSVTVRAEPFGNGVAFEISDTGTGIDPNDLPHVFDRFVKSADSGGAGLGLAIAKSLVQAHGGEITAERHEPSGGTTIRFQLPTSE